MPDNIVKTFIEIDLTDQDREKVVEQIADAVGEGVEKGSKQKFDWSTIKKDLTKSMGDGLNAIWKSSGKVEVKQSKAAQNYLKAQNGVQKAISAQGKGFGKSLGIVKAIGKQGMAGAAGMAANINPYVLAVKAAAEAAKFMADQFQRIAKESSKFVGQGSIFTDKGTMQMMQMTGQTGTQAQATQRSLGSLGMEFSDIQSGKITAEQAALFEQLRLRELKKLEEINAVAGPMFKSMQQVTLGITLLLQDVNDWITMAMAAAPGIQTMIGSIKGFLERAGGFLKSAIDTYLTPIFSVVGNIVTLALDLIGVVMDAMQPIFMIISPILDTVMILADILTKVLSPLIKIGGMIFGAFKFLKIFMGPLGILMVVLDMLNPLLTTVSDAVGKFGGMISNLLVGPINLLNSVIGSLKNFEVLGIKPFASLKPIEIEGVTSGLSNTGASYESQTTNNYVYGSQSMSQANPTQNNNNLFSNSYVLVND